MSKAETYYVIVGSPDGGCSCYKMTRRQLLDSLKPDGEGGFDRWGSREILSELPESIDNFEDLVIIKGEIVVPKPKTIVQEYDL